MALLLHLPRPALGKKPSEGENAIVAYTHSPDNVNGVETPLERIYSVVAPRPTVGPSKISKAQAGSRSVQGLHDGGGAATTSFKHLDGVVPPDKD